jgi:hypothetical protein
MLDTTIYVFIPLLCGAGISSATWAALIPRPLTTDITSTALDHAQHPEDKLASQQDQPSRREPIACSNKHRHHARLKKQTTSYAKKTNTIRICPPQLLPLTRKRHRGLTSQRESLQDGISSKETSSTKIRGRDHTRKNQPRNKTTTDNTTRRHTPIAKMRPLPTPAQQENP